MVPIEKNAKKKAKKASAGTRRSSSQEEKQVATLTADVHAAWRGEEELVDYEPEEPPRFSPIVDDISLPEEHTPTPEEETGEISPHTDELPALFAEDDPMAGGGALANFFRRCPHAKSSSRSRPRRD